MKKLLVFTALCSAWVFAADEESSALEKAFKEGSTSGHIGLYGQYKKLGKNVINTNTKGQTSNKSGYIAPSASFVYSTAPLHGISFAAGAWATDSIYEKLDGDYNGAYGNAEGIVQSNVMLHVMRAKVEHEGLGFVSYGRQEVDLEWAVGYIQGLVANVTPIANLSITAFWAQKYAQVDFDEISSQFLNMNDNKGIQGLDISYTIANILTINPYYYYADSLLQIPGIKLTADVSAGIVQSTTMLHYAKSIVDKSVTNGTYKGSVLGLTGADLVGQKDGQWIQIEETIAFPAIGFHIGAGYIKTDKDGGGGLLGTFDDHQPLEEGNHTFDPNASQVYVFVGYELGIFNAGVMYGNTSYDATSAITGAIEGFKENEIDVSLGVMLPYNLDVELIYAYVDDNFKELDGAKPGSYNLLKGLVRWRF